MRRRPTFLPPLLHPAQLPRFRHGTGTPYVPDVVERVRVLMEGTSLSQAAIAAHVGIGVATVHAWKIRRGWTRPTDVSLSTHKVGIHRAGFTRRLREALSRVEALATREAERLCASGSPEPAPLTRAVAVAALARLARRTRRPAR